MQTYRPIPQSPTMQQLFDHVARHLLEQGAEADNGGHGWVLRDREGRTCAIGCLITPDLLDGLDVKGSELDLPVRLAICESIGIRELPGPTLELLACLREVHDLAYPRERRERLAEVASEHQLDAEAVS
jgi:hypothetical protein